MRFILITTLSFLFALPRAQAAGPIFDFAFWRTQSTGTAVAIDAVGPDPGGASVFESGTSLSWTHIVSGLNRLLVVSVAVDASVDTGMSLSVTDNGVAMTSVGLVHCANASAGFVQLFYLVNPALGANTVSATVSGGTPEAIEGGSVSFTGVNQSTPIRHVASNYGIGTAPSVTVTSASGDMVVDALANGSPITSSNQNLQWLDNNTTNDAAGNAAQSTAAGASSVTMGYTVQDDWWAILGMDIVASGSTVYSGVQYVQGTNPGNEENSEISVSFASNTTAGNSILVCPSWFQISGSNFVLSVSDTQNNSYSVISGTEATYSNSPDYSNLGVGPCYIATGIHGGADTVTVNFNAYGLLLATLAEVSGANSTTPVDQVAATSQASPSCNGNWCTCALTPGATTGNDDFSMITILQDSGSGINGAYVPTTAYQTILNVGGGDQEDGSFVGVLGPAGTYSGILYAGVGGPYVMNMITLKR